MQPIPTTTTSFLSKAIKKEQELKEQRSKEVKKNPNWEYWYTQSYLKNNKKE
jgi:hypothetical protein